MATTKSKLNSKLGKVSDIRFCTSAGKNMCTKIYTAENAKYTIKIGCKQPAKAVNPYQIQYRLRSRYTAANAKTKGADWTKWSAWGNMVQFTKSGTTYNVGNKTNPDEWLKSNKGVNKKSSYMTFYTFDNAGITSTYDARQYQVRIRTYNASTRKHGSWVNSSSLTIYKAAKVIDETVHRGADGSFMLDCNYIWDRGGTVHIDSIMDTDGRELLKAPVTRAMNYDSQRRAGSTPALKSGYTPGEFEIALGKIKRDLEYGESLAINAWYQTKDGAKTYFKTPITVSRQDTTIDQPRVTVDKDETRGYMTVRVYKAQASDYIETISGSLSYTFRGKKYAVKPAKSTVDLSVADTVTPMATYIYRWVPLNTALIVQVTVGNDYHSTQTFKATVQMDIDRFMVNSVNDPQGLTAAVDGRNASMSIDSAAKITTGLPYGRQTPFAVYTPGRTTKIRLAGKVFEDAVSPSRLSARMTRRWWDAIRNNPGIYMLRTPDGQMYQIATSNVSIAKTNEAVCQFSLDSTEVS